jgi:chemotaxis methyl-accepting protein methylase
VEHSQSLRKLEEALAERYGWTISPAAREKIRLAVASKAGRVQIEPDEYCRLAAASESELLSIVEEADSGETYFFREPGQFAFLKQEILPETIASCIAVRRPGNRLRVWSAACSTGEEAYSIAITFDQIKPAELDHRLDVFATDVRNGALLEATRARYAESALQLADEETRHRYFEKSDGNYAVVPDIRRLVTFRRVNLLDDLFWRGVVDRYDLIVCTNLLQHLHSAAVRRMAARLAQALRPGCYLMVAPGEGRLVDNARLRPVKEVQSFFRRTA